MVARPWRVSCPVFSAAGADAAFAGARPGGSSQGGMEPRSGTPFRLAAGPPPPMLRLMALPVLPLLAVGLLGYAGYRAAKTATAAAAERDRRRDWSAVQDPEAVAAGKEEVAHGGGATEDDALVEGSADPWAETDAEHPDESSSDSLDDHPQPEDEAPPRPGG